MQKVLNSLALRVIAFFLVITLTMTGTGMSAPTPNPAIPVLSVMPSFYENTSRILSGIPQDYGSVPEKSMIIEKTGKPFVIHIQDAHANPDAQESIRKILAYLAGEFKTSPVYIALEGAAGELHPEFFNFFPEHPMSSKKVIRDLTEKGELSGAEIFLWERYLKGLLPNSPAEEIGGNVRKIFGMEDAEIYKINYEAYQELLQNQPENRRELAAVYRNLWKRINQTGSAELKEFLKERERRKDGHYAEDSRNFGEGDLAVYLDYLELKALEKAQIDLKDPVEQLRFPNLVRIARIKSIEQGIEPQTLNREWQALLASLNSKIKGSDKEIAAEIERFAARQGWYGEKPVNGRPGEIENRETVSPRRLLEDLVRLLREKKINVSAKSEVFWNAWKLAVFHHELDASGLMTEMDQLEKAVLSKIAAKADDQGIIRSLYNFELLRKSIYAELSREEYGQLSERLEEIRNLAGSNLRPRLGRALAFYEAAFQRDSAMVENAFREIASDSRQVSNEVLGKTGPSGAEPVLPILIMITGGFHYQGIRDILQGKSSGYAAVMPRIHRLDYENRYEKVMAGTHADLSTYFGISNPFETKQEALLFRELMEQATPFLFNDAAMRPDQISRELHEAIRRHPVLGGAMRSEIRGDGDESMVRITPLTGREPVNPSGNALSAVLVSSSPAFVRRVSSAKETARFVRTDSATLYGEPVRRRTGRMTPYDFQIRSRQVLDYVVRSEVRSPDSPELPQKINLGRRRFMTSVASLAAGGLSLEGFIEALSAEEKDRRNEEIQLPEELLRNFKILRSTEIEGKDFRGRPNGKKTVISAVDRILAADRIEKLYKKTSIKREMASAWFRELDLTFSAIAGRIDSHISSDDVRRRMAILNGMKKNRIDVATNPEAQELMKTLVDDYLGEVYLDIALIEQMIQWTAGSVGSPDENIALPASRILFNETVTARRKSMTRVDQYRIQNPILISADPGEKHRDRVQITLTSINRDPMAALERAVKGLQARLEPLRKSAGVETAAIEKLDLEIKGFEGDEKKLREEEQTLAGDIYREEEKLKPRVISPGDPGAAKRALFGQLREVRALAKKAKGDIERKAEEAKLVEIQKQIDGVNEKIKSLREQRSLKSSERTQIIKQKDALETKRIDHQRRLNDLTKRIEAIQEILSSIEAYLAAEKAAGRRSEVRADSVDFEGVFRDVLLDINRMAFTVPEAGLIHDYLKMNIKNVFVLHPEKDIFLKNQKIHVGQGSLDNREILTKKVVEAGKILLVLSKLELEGGQKAAASKALQNTAIAIRAGEQVAIQGDRILVGMDEKYPTVNLTTLLINAAVAIRKKFSQEAKNKAALSGRLLELAKANIARQTARQKQKVGPEVQTAFVKRLEQFRRELKSLEGKSDETLAALKSGLTDLSAQVAAFEASQKADYTFYRAIRFDRALREEKVALKVVERFLAHHEAGEAGQWIAEHGYAAYRTAQMARDFAAYEDSVTAVRNLVEDLRIYAAGQILVAGHPEVVQSLVAGIHEDMVSVFETGKPAEEAFLQEIFGFLNEALNQSRLYMPEEILEAEKVLNLTAGYFQSPVDRNFVFQAAALALLLRAGSAQAVEGPEGEEMVSPISAMLSRVTALLEILKVGLYGEVSAGKPALVAAAWLSGAGEAAKSGLFKILKTRSEVRAGAEPDYLKNLDQLILLATNPETSDLIRSLQTGKPANPKTAELFQNVALRAREAADLQKKISHAMKSMERAASTLTMIHSLEEEAETPPDAARPATIGDQLYEALDIVSGGKVSFHLAPPEAKPEAVRPRQISFRISHLEAQGLWKVYIKMHPETQVPNIADMLFRVAQYIRDKGLAEDQHRTKETLQAEVKDIFKQTHGYRIGYEEIPDDLMNRMVASWLSGPELGSKAAAGLSVFGIDVEAGATEDSLPEAFTFHFYSPEDVARILGFLSEKSFRSEMTRIFKSKIPSQQELDETVRVSIKARGIQPPGVTEVQKMRVKIAAGESIPPGDSAVDLILESDTLMKQMEGLLPAAVDAMNQVREYFVKRLEGTKPDAEPVRISRNDILGAISIEALSPVARLEESIGKVLKNQAYQNPAIGDPVSLMQDYFASKVTGTTGQALSEGRNIQEIFQGLKRYYNQPHRRWQLFAVRLNPILEKAVEENNLVPLSQFFMNLVTTYATVAAIEAGRNIAEGGIDAGTAQQAAKDLAEDVILYFNSGGQYGRRGDGTYVPKVVEAIRAIDSAMLPSYLRQKVVTEDLPYHIEQALKQGRISKRVAAQVAREAASRGTDQNFDQLLVSAAKEARQALGGSVSAGLLGGASRPAKKAAALIGSNQPSGGQPGQTESKDEPIQAISIKGFKPVHSAEMLGVEDLIKDLVSLFQDLSRPGVKTAEPAEEGAASQTGPLEAFAERYPASWRENMERAVAGSGTLTNRSDGLILDELSEWLITMIQIYTIPKSSALPVLKKVGRIEQAFTGYREQTQIIADDAIQSFLAEINRGRKPAEQIKESEVIATSFILWMIRSYIKFVEMRHGAPRSLQDRGRFIQSLSQLAPSVPLFGIVLSQLTSLGDSAIGAVDESRELDEEARRETEAQRIFAELKKTLQRAADLGQELAEPTAEGFLERVRTMGEKVQDVLRSGLPDSAREAVGMLLSGKAVPDAAGIDKESTVIAADFHPDKVAKSSARMQAVYGEIFKFGGEAYKYAANPDQWRQRDTMIQKLPKLIQAVKDLDELKAEELRDEAAQKETDRAQREDALLKKMDEVVIGKPGQSASGTAAPEWEEGLKILRGLKDVPERLAGIERAIESLVASLTGKQSPPAAARSTLNDFMRQDPDDSDKKQYIQLMAEGRTPDSGREDFRIYENGSMTYRKGAAGFRALDLSAGDDKAFVELPGVSQFWSRLMHNRNEEILMLTFKGPQENGITTLLVLRTGDMFEIKDETGIPLISIQPVPEILANRLAKMPQVLEFLVSRSEVRTEDENWVLLGKDTISYPNAGLKGLPAQKTDAVFIDIDMETTPGLSVMTWPKRVGAPLTEDELKIFERDEGLSKDFDSTQHDIAEVRHTSYDRSSGIASAKAVFKDHSGQKFYVDVSGVDTTSLETLKSVMPRLESLQDPAGTVLQASMGNQGDLPGNFTLTNLKGTKDWIFYGASDEMWHSEGKSYRVLVEYTNGTRELGVVRLKGDTAKNKISEVSFLPVGSNAAKKLDPQKTRFVLAANTLGWGDENPKTLLRENYSQTSDLRHIFGFPYFKKEPVFYFQLTGDATGESLNRAFDDKPLTFRLVLQSGEAIDDRETFEKVLSEFGYKAVASAEEVKVRGDYFISGDSITFIFQPAVYPVNALAVSADGKHAAIVTIPGKSGNIGATYETVYEWAKEQVASRFDWDVHALFALDNGMDPQVVRINNIGVRESYAAGGRDALNAGLNVLGKKSVPPYPGAIRAVNARVQNQTQFLKDRITGNAVLLLTVGLFLNPMTALLFWLSIFIHEAGHYSLARSISLAGRFDKGPIFKEIVLDPFLFTISWSTYREMQLTFSGRIFIALGGILFNGLSAVGILLGALFGAYELSGNVISNPWLFFLYAHLYGAVRSAIPKLGLNDAFQIKTMLSDMALAKSAVKHYKNLSQPTSEVHDGQNLLIRTHSGFYAIVRGRSPFDRRSIPYTMESIKVKKNIPLRIEFAGELVITDAGKKTFNHRGKPYALYRVTNFPDELRELFYDKGEAQQLDKNIQRSEVRQVMPVVQQWAGELRDDLRVLHRIASAQATSDSGVPSYYVPDDAGRQTYFAQALNNHAVGIQTEIKWMQSLGVHMARTASVAGGTSRRREILQSSKRILSISAELAETLGENVRAARSEVRSGLADGLSSILDEADELTRENDELQALIDQEMAMNMALMHLVDYRDRLSAVWENIRTEDEFRAVTQSFRSEREQAREALLNALGSVNELNPKANVSIDHPEIASLLNEIENTQIAEQIRIVLQNIRAKVDEKRDALQEARTRRQELVEAIQQPVSKSEEPAEEVPGPAQQPLETVRPDSQETGEAAAQVLQETRVPRRGVLKVFSWMAALTGAGAIGGIIGSLVTGRWQEGAGGQTDGGVAGGVPGDRTDAPSQTGESLPSTLISRTPPEAQETKASGVEQPAAAVAPVAEPPFQPQPPSQIPLREYAADEVIPEVIDDITQAGDSQEILGVKRASIDFEALRESRRLDDHVMEQELVRMLFERLNMSVAIPSLIPREEADAAIQEGRSLTEILQARLGEIRDRELAATEDYRKFEMQNRFLYHEKDFLLTAVPNLLGRLGYAEDAGIRKAFLESLLTSVPVLNEKLATLTVDDEKWFSQLASNSLRFILGNLEPADARSYLDRNWQSAHAGMPAWITRQVYFGFLVLNAVASPRVQRLLDPRYRDRPASKFPSRDAQASIILSRVTEESFATALPFWEVSGKRWDHEWQLIQTLTREDFERVLADESPAAAGISRFEVLTAETRTALRQLLDGKLKNLSMTAEVYSTLTYNEYFLLRPVIHAKVRSLIESVPLKFPSVVARGFDNSAGDSSFGLPQRTRNGRRVVFDEFHSEIMLQHFLASQAMRLLNARYLDPFHDLEVIRAFRSAEPIEIFHELERYGIRQAPHEAQDINRIFLTLNLQQNRWTDLDNLARLFAQGIIDFTRITENVRIPGPEERIDPFVSHGIHDTSGAYTASQYGLLGFARGDGTRIEWFRRSIGGTAGDWQTGRERMDTAFAAQNRYPGEYIHDPDHYPDPNIVRVRQAEHFFMDAMSLPPPGADRLSPNIQDLARRLDLAADSHPVGHPLWHAEGTAWAPQPYRADEPVSVAASRGGFSNPESINVQIARRLYDQAFRTDVYGVNGEISIEDLLRDFTTQQGLSPYFERNYSNIFGDDFFKPSGDASRPAGYLYLFLTRAGKDFFGVNQQGEADVSTADRQTRIQQFREWIASRVAAGNLPREHHVIFEHLLGLRSSIESAISSGTLEQWVETERERIRRIPWLTDEGSFEHRILEIKNDPQAFLRKLDGLMVAYTGQMALDYWVTVRMAWVVDVREKMRDKDRALQMNALRDRLENIEIALPGIEKFLGRKINLADPTFRDQGIVSKIIEDFEARGYRGRSMFQILTVAAALKADPRTADYLEMITEGKLSELDDHAREAFLNGSYIAEAETALRSARPGDKLETVAPAYLEEVVRYKMEAARTKVNFRGVMTQAVGYANLLYREFGDGRTVPENAAYYDLPAYVQGLAQSLLSGAAEGAHSLRDDEARRLELYEKQYQRLSDELKLIQRLIEKKNDYPMNFTDLQSGERSDKPAIEWGLAGVYPGRPSYAVPRELFEMTFEYYLGVYLGMYAPTSRELLNLDQMRNSGAADQIARAAEIDRIQTQIRPDFEKNFSGSSIIRNIFRRFWIDRALETFEDLRKDFPSLDTRPQAVEPATDEMEAFIPPFIPRRTSWASAMGMVGLFLGIKITDKTPLHRRSFLTFGISDSESRSEVRSETPGQTAEELQSAVLRAHRFMVHSRARAAEMERANRDMLKLFEERRRFIKAGNTAEAAQILDTLIRGYQSVIRQYAARIQPEEPAPKSENPAVMAAYQARRSAELAEYQKTNDLAGHARSLRERSAELKKRIDSFAPRFEALYRSQDTDKNEKLDRLNYEAVAVHKTRILTQLNQLVTHLEMTAPNETAVLSILIALRDSYLRLSREYGWRWRRAIGRAVKAKVWVVGLQGRENRIYDYPSFRIFDNPEAEKGKRITIKKHQWYRQDLGEGTFTYAPRLTDVFLESLDKAYRQQIHIIAGEEKEDGTVTGGQEQDYEQVMSRLNAVAYIRQLYEDYGAAVPSELAKEIPGLLHDILDQVPGALRHPSVRVPQKRQAAASISAAMIDIEAGRINEAVGLLKSAEEQLESRLRDIEKFKEGVQSRADHFIHEIRKEETARAITELEGLMASRHYKEAGDLLTLLYQTHYQTLALHNDQYRSLKLRVSWLKSLFQRLQNIQTAFNALQPGETDAAGKRTHIEKNRSRFEGQVGEYLKQMRLMTRPSARSEVRSKAVDDLVKAIQGKGIPSGPSQMIQFLKELQADSKTPLPPDVIFEESGSRIRIQNVDETLRVSRVPETEESAAFDHPQRIVELFLRETAHKGALNRYEVVRLSLSDLLAFRLSGAKNAREVIRGFQALQQAEFLPSDLIYEEIEAQPDRIRIVQRLLEHRVEKAGESDITAAIDNYEGLSRLIRQETADRRFANRLNLDELPLPELLALRAGRAKNAAQVVKALKVLQGPIGFLPADLEFSASNGSIVHIRNANTDLSVPAFSPEMNQVQSGNWDEMISLMQRESTDRPFLDKQNVTKMTAEELIQMRIVHVKSAADAVKGLTILQRRLLIPGGITFEPGSRKDRILIYNNDPRVQLPKITITFPSAIKNRDKTAGTIAAAIRRVVRTRHQHADYDALLDKVSMSATVDFALRMIQEEFGTNPFRYAKERVRLRVSLQSKLDKKSGKPVKYLIIETENDGEPYQIENSPNGNRPGLRTVATRLRTMLHETERLSKLSVEARAKELEVPSLKVYWDLFTMNDKFLTKKERTRIHRALDGVIQSSPSDSPAKKLKALNNFMFGLPPSIPRTVRDDVDQGLETAAGRGHGVVIGLLEALKEEEKLPFVARIVANEPGRVAQRFEVPLRQDKENSANLGEFLDQFYNSFRNLSGMHGKIFEYQESYETKIIRSEVRSEAPIIHQEALETLVREILANKEKVKQHGAFIFDMQKTLAARKQKITPHMAELLLLLLEEGIEVVINSGNSIEEVIDQLLQPLELKADELGKRPALTGLTVYASSATTKVTYSDAGVMQLDLPYQLEHIIDADFTEEIGAGLREIAAKHHFFLTQPADIELARAFFQKEQTKFPKTILDFVWLDHPGTFDLQTVQSGKLPAQVSAPFLEFRSAAYLQSGDQQSLEQRPTALAIREIPPHVRPKILEFLQKRIEAKLGPKRSRQFFLTPGGETTIDIVKHANKVIAIEDYSWNRRKKGRPVQQGFVYYFGDEVRGKPLGNDFLVLKELSTRVVALNPETPRGLGGRQVKRVTHVGGEQAGTEAILEKLIAGFRLAVQAAASGNPDREVQGFGVWKIGDYEVTRFGAAVISGPGVWQKEDGEQVRQENGLATQGGIPVMLPMNGRTIGGKMLTQDGRWVNVLNSSLTRKVPDGQGGEHALHGFADKVEWQVKKAKKNSITFTITSVEIPVNVEGAATLADIIGNVRFEQTYKVKNGTFLSILKTTNLSAEPVVLGGGYHPFYQLPDLENWTIQIPASQVWATDATPLALDAKPKAAAGTEWDFNTPQPLKPGLEVTLSGLKPDAQGRIYVVLRNSKTGETKTISFQAKYFPALLLWVPPTDKSPAPGIFSIEPLFSIPNGRNMYLSGNKQTKPVVIKAGRSHIATWTLSEKIRTEAAPAVPSQELAEKKYDHLKDIILWNDELLEGLGRINAAALRMEEEVDLSEVDAVAGLFIQRLGDIQQLRNELGDDADDVKTQIDTFVAEARRYSETIEPVVNKFPDQFPRVKEFLSTLRSEVRTMPTTAEYKIHELPRIVTPSFRIEEPEFVRQEAAIEEAASRLGVIFSVESIASYLPENVKVIGYDQAPVLGRDQAARLWLAAWLIRHTALAAESAGISNDELKTLIQQFTGVDSLNVKPSEGVFELGDTVHVKLPSLDAAQMGRLIDEFGVILAALLATNASLYLNIPVDGYIQDQAKTLQERILRTAEKAGVHLRKGQFQVVAMPGETTFASLPNRQLNGEHQILGDDTSVTDIVLRKGIEGRWAYGEKRIDADELTAHILVVLKHLLNKEISDRYTVRNARRVDPETFAVALQIVNAFLAQARLRASA